MVNRRRSARADTAPPFRADDGRWQELLDIAARIFARKGYKSTTLQDIADEFGVLKGSLYHYIRSKDDLLFEVVHSVYEEGLANLRAVAGADLDPVERLRAVVRGHVVYLIDNLVETTVLLHEFDQLSDERRARMPIRDYQTLIADLVAEAKADGRLKPDVDPQLAALAVLGATNWVYRWYRPGARSPEEIADQYADLLVDGMLLPDRRSAGAAPERAGASPGGATG
ncbi:TetR/AcrR family transcriptional regulator [Pseudonocardia parietis]|uniref:AcrR family transcriptional regulator n=1 Tax=Pseudonocardia parietis TaxID=570936 RepID=A0ABS4VSJ2_9PSEU|nr:TetR/AcrR family transcriptional regulator [Pseudonocardia parietis]MBP2366519.1 AcrR family transcriptional regulator [Pseudonocardia parietis]